MDMMNAVIGNKALSEVTPLDALGVFSESFSLCRDSYIKKGLYLYRALFDAAIACKYITTNPFRDKTAQPPMKDDCQSHRAITDEERYYIETTPHRIQPVAMLMLYAGLRDSEALAICVDRDIDFTNRVIHLRQFRHTDHNQAFVNDKGKTKRAARDIGLFPQLAECLSGRSGLVVSMKDGSVLSDCAWRRGWESFVNAIERRMNGCQRRWYGKRKTDLERKAAYDRLMASGHMDEAQQYKMPEWKTFDVVPYSLRHSFCTYCRDHSIEINVCREWMGHSDLKMIMKIYDHVSDERKATELQKIYDEHKLTELGQNLGQLHK